MNHWRFALCRDNELLSDRVLCVVLSVCPVAFNTCKHFSVRMCMHVVRHKMCFLRWEMWTVLWFINTYSFWLRLLINWWHIMLLPVPVLGSRKVEYILDCDQISWGPHGMVSVGGAVCWALSLQMHGDSSLLRSGLIVFRSLSDRSLQRFSMGTFQIRSEKTSSQTKFQPWTAEQQIYI